MCWPVTPRGVAGPSRGDAEPCSASRVEVVLEARGELGGPESPGTDGTVSPSVPLSTAPPSLLCPKWIGVEGPAVNTCAKGTEADQSQG